MSEHGKLQTVYSSRGNRKYEMEIWHNALNKRQVIRGIDKFDVEQRARSKMEQWNKIAEKQDGKQLAIERTKQAKEEIEALGSILSVSLARDSSLNWEILKNTSDYHKTKPIKPIVPKMNFIVKLVPAWREKFERRVREQQEKFEKEHAKWNSDAKTYLQQRDEQNILIDKKREKYLAGEVNAIVEYCDVVLSNSEYPDYFPQSYEIDYRPDNKLFIIDYQLPSPDKIPTLREVVYVQSRNEFTERHIPQSQMNNMYDSLLYQIVLRTINELYQADKINALQSVVFNGFVNSIDPATGHIVEPCVLTVQVSKDEFKKINLANVDPKVCFKSFKGIGSSQLYSLTPIAPLLKINREDARFISSYGVANNLDQEVNIAAMDWEDFEHLVRELFEKEFVSVGGEVKVTRASRDAGVDAVAFDPDPIRGGKIVIQAKRYSNTVDVSAVRDLYGTVLNEGATKGILVTTSDY
jgi:restriction system protein